MFYGRKRELKELEKFFDKKTASLIVIKGRRRIGKSTLVGQFAKGTRFLPFIGLPPTEKTTRKSQIDLFSRQLSALCQLPQASYEDWDDLFQMLAAQTKEKRVIILLDEISWMGSKDPDFLGKLKNAWDLSFKKNKKLILILCGSVSAWIEKNILSSTGFMGRISYAMTLKELSLEECNEFWRGGGAKVSVYEKFKILAVTGGVPRYLEEINPNRTAEANIRDLCFKQGGILTTEFDHIFHDLFSKRGTFYKEIVQILVDGPQDYTTLANLLGKKPTGFLTSYLTDLVQAGFISRDFSWHFKEGKEGLLSHYRLSDNYLRFYLKYIDKIKNKIAQNAFDEESFIDQQSTIMGLQFENLVLNNRSLVLEALGIRLEDVVSHNPYCQRKTARSEGCQIDYMIQTKFNNLFVCEIKFSTKPVEPTVIKEVRTKISRLILPKGFSCWPVLVHVNGVSESVEDAGYFSKIIDFGRYLA